MSDLNDKVKILLAKAKETGDMELIDLATDLLSVEAPKQPVKQEKAQPQGEFEFVMKQENESSVGGVPVNKTQRVNTFVDDGTEARDITTPDIKPTERRRKPYKPVEQTCSRCNKIESVNPTHARENYV